MFFFFNDTATTEIYTLSLHDALPISGGVLRRGEAPAQHRPDAEDLEVLGRDAAAVDPLRGAVARQVEARGLRGGQALEGRSEEHTSELQSRQYLVCRLLLEKKN